MGIGIARLMLFSIITPSFNQLDHLKRGVASVADPVVKGAFSNGQSAVSSNAVSINGRKNAKDLASDATDNYQLRIMAGGNGSHLTVSSLIYTHHHVQDGESTDGSCEWLKKTADTTLSSCDTQSDEDVVSSFTYQLTCSCEADAGMYDAINRGVKLAFKGSGNPGLGDGRTGRGGLTTEDRRRRTENRGRLGSRGERIANSPASVATDNSQLRIMTEGSDSQLTAETHDSVVAWLNCDEQYLPDTLKKVVVFFESNPEVDILFGGMLVVDESGELLSCRKAMPMRRLFLDASYLYNYSCAMFFRRSAWERLGGFDTSFKNAGDEDLIRRAMKLGLKTAVLDDYLATFTYSGQNLSSDPASVKEHERLKAQNPKWVNWFRMPINMLRLCEKFLRGGHVQNVPVEYEIYVGDNPHRTKFRSEKPSCKWPGHSMPYLTSHRLRRSN